MVDIDIEVEPSFGILEMTPELYDLPVRELWVAGEVSAGESTNPRINQVYPALISVDQRMTYIIPALNDKFAQFGIRRGDVLYIAMGVDAPNDSLTWVNIGGRKHTLFHYLDGYFYDRNGQGNLCDVMIDSGYYVGGVVVQLRRSIG